MTYKYKPFIILDSSDPENHLFREGLKQAQDDFQSFSAGQVILDPTINEIKFDLSWTKYSSRNGNQDKLGANLTDLLNYQNRIWESYGSSIDSVMWVFGRDNWLAEGYAGWNLGVYLNLGLQVMKRQLSAHWNNLLFQHETMHVLDDLYYHDQGKQLDHYLGFDYDFDKAKGVHALNKQGKHANEFEDLFQLIQPFLMANLVYRRWDYMANWQDKIRVKVGELLGRYKRDLPEEILS